LGNDGSFGYDLVGAFNHPGDNAIGNIANALQDVSLFDLPLHELSNSLASGRSVSRK
jgi:hypothetical protein